MTPSVKRAVRKCVLCAGFASGMVLLSGCALPAGLTQLVSAIPSLLGGNPTAAVTALAGAAAGAAAPAAPAAAAAPAANTAASLISLTRTIAGTPAIPLPGGQ